MDKKRRRDFIAVASLLWRNIETVHRTVSLSLSALLRNFFAPISGSSPSAPKQKTTRLGGFYFGGEGGTRTLAPVSRPTPLAGAPRHQLEYFSMWCRSRLFIKLDGGESGIRTHGSRESLVFKTSSLNRSDISPH